MANLKDIRKRIVSVKNTQKITRVMTMISASKLHKARQAIHQSRPYHNKLQEIFVALCKNAPETLEVFRREVKNSEGKSAVVLFTSDRGLCGAFNSGLCKKLVTFLKERKNTDLFIIGKKGKDFFDHLNNFFVVSGHYKKKEIELKNEVPKIAAMLIKEYLLETYDEIYLAFNCFISSVTQEPKIQKFLPIDFITSEADTLEESTQALFEPSLKEISSKLIPNYLENFCYLCLLDSFAGEHASRMRVMDAATNNARDLIIKLQMQYNRARQANITTELTEIISGAESV